MARSKDDVKYGTAQAKMSEDEALRIRYKHGTPLEGLSISSRRHNTSLTKNIEGGQAKQGVHRFLSVIGSLEELGAADMLGSRFCTGIYITAVAEWTNRIIS